MLVLGILIGLWVGVPIGVLLVAMLGPREREVLHPRSMQDLLARHYPTAPGAAPTTPPATAEAPTADANPEPGRRHA
jgi:hypothetical protein